MKLCFVELTYGGGWKQLHDMQWSAKFSNTYHLIETILLALILWRIW